MWLCEVAEQLKLHDAMWRSQWAAMALRDYCSWVLSWQSTGHGGMSDRPSQMVFSVQHWHQVQPLAPGRRFGLAEVMSLMPR